MMKKIMVVGLMHDRYIAQHYAKCFEQAGHTVIRVACDLYNPRDSGRHDFHILDFAMKRDANFGMKLHGQLSKFYMSEIEQKYNPDFIFEVQHGIIIDYKDVDCPVYYHATEPLIPSLPINANLQGLFYSWIGGEAELKAGHPFEITNLLFDPYFILLGYDGSIFPLRDQSKPYEIEFGFKGMCEYMDGKSSLDYKVRHIYDNRLRIIEFARENCNLTFEGHANLEDYLIFMHKVNVALNISGNFGCINDRTFHAMAIGCVLLNFEDPEYPSLKNYGFINKVNCLLFSNEMELINQLIWIRTHPGALEEIREQGRRFALLQTYQRRGKEILSKLTKEGVLD